MPENPFAKFARPSGGPVYGAPPKEASPAEQARLELERERNELARERVEIARSSEERAAQADRNNPSARRQRANTIRAQLKRIRDLYESDIKGNPMGRAFGLTEYIDVLPTNDRFADAGRQILPLIRPLIAQSAREGDSNTEMTIFQSYVPHNDDTDINIENKLAGMEVLIQGMIEGRPPSELVEIYDLEPGKRPKSRRANPADIEEIMRKYGD